jgi:hypothetical protein
MYIIGRNTCKNKNILKYKSILIVLQPSARQDMSLIRIQRPVLNVFLAITSLRKAMKKLVSSVAMAKQQKLQDLNHKMNALKV